MKPRNFRTLFLIICIFLLIFSASVLSQNSTFTQTDQYNNLRMGNDYIVIVVNQDQNAQGRFAIETTGGAPFREEDNQKPLVYGRPKPWTSYTTLLIDNKAFVFGGETGRRAGRNGNYGEITQAPQVEDGKIVTTCNFNGIKVKQLLTIVKSSTTGLFNSVKIEYEITNNTSQNHKIGLRLMLDTMLGENDGAPFRIKEEAVDNDKLFLQNELPNFWQAFDSISNPKVTAQGTFKGPGVTTPDKVNLSDWGSLADGVWDFDFNPGQEFVRKGEYEIDSAIALYWSPVSIGPGQTKTYATKYGLGGITIVPGLISLGVTSPAEVTFSPEKETFPVIAYIENTSEIEAKNVNITLDLPQNYTAEDLSRELGNMASGSINQITWNVYPQDKELLPESSNIKYSVEVTADNTDPNQVERDVKVYGPPQLNINLNVEKLELSKESIKPNPFKVTASIQNAGGSILRNPVSKIDLPPGLVLPAHEKKEKLLGELKPGEKIDVSWHIKALSGAEGTLPFVLNIKGDQNYVYEKTGSAKIPGTSPLVYLSPRASGKNENYVILDIQGQNLEEVEQVDLSVNFNSEYFKPISILPGEVFVDQDQLELWQNQTMEEGTVIIKNQLPPGTSKKSTVISSIVFKILQKEDFIVNWGHINCTDRSGEKIEVKQNNLTKKIEVKIE